MEELSYLPQASSSGGKERLMLFNALQLECKVKMKSCYMLCGNGILCVQQGFCPDSLHCTKTCQCHSSAGRTA